MCQVKKVNKFGKGFVPFPLIEIKGTFQLRTIEAFGTVGFVDQRRSASKNKACRTSWLDGGVSNGHLISQSKFANFKVPKNGVVCKNTQRKSF